MEAHLELRRVPPRPLPHKGVPVYGMPVRERQPFGEVEEVSTTRN